MFAIFLWSACVCAFSALACAMSKHQKDIFGASLSDKKALLFKVMGWCVIVLTFVGAWFIKGFTIGVSLWCCALSLSALVVGLSITYIPKKLIIVCMIAIVICILSLIE